MSKNVALIIFTFFFLKLFGQETTLIKDTIYYRYDHTIGKPTLSNYYELKSKINQNEIKIERYYRFTKPHLLKEVYIENSNGVKDGEYSSYDRDGALKEEGIYKGENKEGIWLFYRDGYLQRKVNFVKGKREGKAIYYAKGDSLYSWNWKNHASEGYNEGYHDNGNLRYKGDYINGNEEGIHERYYENGKIVSRVSFVKGKLMGKAQYFYKNGLIREEGEYVDGLQSGVWKYYRKNNTVASFEKYKKGKLKSVQFYNENGEKEKSKKSDVFTGVIEERRRLQKNIQKHIKSNLVYPQDMLDQGFESKVIVHFKIDEEGYVEDISPKSESHEDFEIEAESLLESLPKQTPATAHNLPIRVAYNLPIVFRND